MMPLAISLKKVLWTWSAIWQPVFRWNWCLVCRKFIIPNSAHPVATRASSNYPFFFHSKTKLQFRKCNPAALTNGSQPFR